MTNINSHQCKFCEKMCRSEKHKLDHQKYVCNSKDLLKNKENNQTTIINIANLNIINNGDKNQNENETFIENENENSDCIYLIWEREFKRLNESIYKFGKTTKFSTRMGNYPKNSDILLVLKVKDCHSIEKIILKKLQYNFKQCKDIGFEYFQGNVYEMIQLICLEVTGSNNDDYYDDEY